ncbi:uncharacterized protein LOC115034223 isoform X2 [Acyrthosiphon pisum]|uniref:Uncharacterized protein n=1 Tax=Acyrthosiphon pisum TaxID=7029 RepID=A0A8R2JTU4_ACYPI|nr:uncharacterized protein LOC115034223 isoform X2 [Acyrthosiphon pisum]
MKRMKICEYPDIEKILSFGRIVQWYGVHANNTQICTFAILPQPKYITEYGIPLTSYLQL